MEIFFELKIHQIKRITGRNGKIQYSERKYAKNEVLLEPGWSSDPFEFHEPEFYKLVTRVTRDDDSQNIYTLPVGRCNQQKSVKEYK